VENAERKKEEAGNKTQDQSYITLFTQIKNQQENESESWEKKREKKSTPIPPPKKNKREKNRKVI